MITKNIINSGKSEKLFLALYGLFALLSGIFISAFDVNVHSLFFEHFGYKYLATTYILGGIAGMITLYLFTLVYKTINTKTLTFLSISSIMLFAGTYLILELAWPIKWIYYFGMVILFPANTLLVLTLWRYARKLTYPRYTRKVFPLIQFLFFAGIALGGGGITIGLYFFNYTGIIVLTFVSLVALWFTVPVLNYVYNKFSGFTRPEEKYIPVQRNFFLFWTSKYTRILFLFSFLSAMVGFSIHFVFVNLAWVEFRNILGMSKFYGLFTAIAIVFVFGIDRFIIKRILYSYDSPYSLVLIPVAILIGIVITFLSPVILGSRFSSQHFTLFFLLIAITKVGYITFNYTVQIPSLRTLFHLLDLRYRQVAYPRVEGSMLMAGLTVAGIIFLALSFFKFFSVSIVLIFAGLTCVFWLWVTIKLIKEYKGLQEKELAKLRFRRSENESDMRIDDHLQQIFIKNEPEKIIEALKISARIQPFEYENHVKRLLATPNNKVRKFLLGSIEKERMISTLEELKSKSTSLNDNEREIFNKVIKKLEVITNFSVTEQLIKERIYSRNIEERIDLAYALSKSDIQDKEGILIALTKDFDIEVQNAAIKALAAESSGNYCYSLIDFLYPGNYNPYAFDAIAASKDIAVSYLEKESLLPGIDDVALTRIIKLYGRIGTKNAVELLLSKMGEIDSHVLIHSIQALVDNRFQAGKEDKLKILSHIVRVIGFITYNLNIYNQLKNKVRYKLLYEAYEREINTNYIQLFRLLSLVYNSNVISTLEKIFTKGSRAEICHGIELVDYYIDDDIKPLIFPLFEDLPVTEKLKRLDYYFPQVKMPVNEIISSTLTYDFNALSLYPRACAIMLIDQLALKGFGEELIFCANHPDQLLSETAQFVLRKQNSVVSDFRLPENMDSEPSAVPQDVNNLLFSRFNDLIKYPAFDMLSEIVVIELAKSMKEFEYSKGEILKLDQTFNEYSLILLNRSKVTTEKQIIWNSKGVFYLPLLKELEINEFRMNENCTIKAFKSDIVNELIYDNVDLSGLVLSAINNLQTANYNEQ